MRTTGIVLIASALLAGHFTPPEEAAKLKEELRSSTASGTPWPA